jgi:uncharacterized protein YeaO (DUF488 family)
MRVKKFLIIGFVILMSGCSTKFAYNNLDWLAYWYIDDYIELTSEQEEAVDIKLQQWLSWHKSEELPKYLAHLSELSEDIRSQSISMARMDYHQDKAAEHWLRLKTRIVPDLVTLAPLLNEQQIEDMFAEIDKQNEEEAEERAERQEKSEAKRKKDGIKRNKKNLKKWLGALTPEQDRLIENMYGQYHRNGALWQAYRERYQAELKGLFKEQDRGVNFQQRLQELLMYPEVFRGEELNRRNLENGNKYKEFLLAVDTLATEKQRKHLIAEIADFSDDVKDLLGD